MSRRRQKKKKEEGRKVRSQTDWARLAGQMTLLTVALVVPLIISKRSSVVTDVKDVALGVGVVVGLSIWLMASLARGRLEWVRSRLNVAVIAFVAWAGLTVFHSQHWYVTVSEFGRLAAHIGLYLLAIFALRRATEVRRIIGAACVAGVPVCIYAFVQAAGRDPIVWDVAPGRVMSFLGNATYLASFLVLVLPLAVAAGWPRARGTEENANGGGSAGGAWVSAMFLLVAGMMVVCLYYTVSISPMIGLMLGGLIAGAVSHARGGLDLARKAAPWILIGVVAAGGLGLVGYWRLPKRQQGRVQKVLHFKDPHGRLRQMQWRVAWDLFREHPVGGMGYGTFRVYSLERLSAGWYADLGKSTGKMLVPSYAHNEYLQVLAGTGAVGGTVFLALIVLLYATGLRVSLRHPDDNWRRIGMAITVAATAYLVQNFFGVTFRQTGAATFFWLWLGVLAVAGAWAPAEEKGDELRVRELHFTPLSPVRLTLVGMVLACVVAVLGWLIVRPAVANVMLRDARRAARMAQSVPAEEADVRRGHFRRAAELAQDMIRLSPYSATGYYTAAYAWGELGEYEKALEANKRALELLPGNASFEYNLGVTYISLDRLGEAEESFRRAIELMPTNWQQQGAMAELLLRQGRLEEAAPYAEEAVRLGRRDPKCHMLMADVEVRRGNLEAALKHLRNAGRRAPGDAGIWSQLTALLLRMDKPGEAIRASRTWARADPTSPDPLHALGLARYQRGEYGGARKAFVRALELDEKFLPARLHLGYSYLRLGKPVKAKRELARVVRMGPRTREGKTAKTVLDQIGG